MPRQTPYNVPIDVLTDQGLKTSQAYDDDSQERKELLAGIGLPAAHFARVRELAKEVRALDHSQEQRKQDAQLESAEATAAVEAALSWRNDLVMPRVNLAFEDDPRRVHFRPGGLRSRRAAAVLRECRLLVDAIRRFGDVPEAAMVRLDAALADEGERLCEAIEKEDTEAARAAAARSEATGRLAEAVLELSQALAEIEKRAVVVFRRGTAELRRYRMNGIREYVARMHTGGAGVVDPTVSVEVADPDPGVAEVVEG